MAGFSSRIWLMNLFLSKALLTFFEDAIELKEKSEKVAAR